MARVSVVMSVFNGERFLREAMDSILGQTYRDLELIVIDDGSTDGSAEILARRQEEDPRLRVFPQKNMGLTRSLNRGVQLSTGEYVARMDADVLSIETSRSQMELLDAFRKTKYPNEIGPGVYDIHSPRVPAQKEMTALLRKAGNVLKPEQIWVHPDCGLKTRRWEEVRPALAALVAAAKELRG